MVIKKTLMVHCTSLRSFHLEWSDAEVKKDFKTSNFYYAKTSFLV